MSLGRSITTLCLLPLWVAACTPGEPLLDPEPGPLPAEDSYFATDRVLDVAIELAPEDWETLRFQSRTLSDILGGDCLAAPVDDIFDFFEATVSVDGATLSEVGVRKKGFLGSLSSEKPSLKIRFDKFVEGQLLGDTMARLTLNNVQQDRSRLNTCMTYKVFADAGLPAPRCNFARVAVNGQDMGLYVHVESIKKAFVARNFEDPEGNLYEGTISDFRTGWEGTFQKKTNRSEADWSDINAVTSALEDPSDAGLDALAELVDIDHFLTFWALEAITGHWDSYTGNRNNFYFYRESDGRFVFIPWGPDSAFSPLANPFHSGDFPQSVMARGGIAYRLYQDPASRDAYIERLQELLDSVWDEPALLEEIERMSAIVQSHALPETLVEALDDTDRLRDFVTYRRGQILDELSPQPPDWDWPLDSPDICWDIIGHVDLDFEAIWGSHGADNITEHGDVDINSYEVHGQDLSFIAGGTTAGIETQGQAAGQAAITIGNIWPGGTADLLVVQIQPDLVRQGATLSFDSFNTVGYRLLVPPPYTSFEVVGFLGSGSIELGQASTKPGGSLTGRLDASIFGVD